MHPKKREAYAKAMQAYEFTLPKAPTAPADLFDTPYDSYGLEIGYGSGEHLLHTANTYPERGMIGSEVYHHGVSKCVKALQAAQQKNVKLLVEDGRLLLDQLPDACLDNVYLLFPDPWPKVRHYKRRIVNQDFLHNVARVLKPGGRFRMASDHVDYTEWMWVQLSHSLEHFMLVDADWRRAPKDHTTTRYQQKALEEGRHSVFIEVVKR